jgi:hypothetical protein
LLDFLSCTVIGQNSNLQEISKNNQNFLTRRIEPYRDYLFLQDVFRGNSGRIK